MHVQNKESTEEVVHVRVGNGRFCSHSSSGKYKFNGWVAEDYCAHLEGTKSFTLSPGMRFARYARNEYLELYFNGEVPCRPGILSGRSSYQK